MQSARNTVPMMPYSDLASIGMRLGEFHTLMTFLGYVGYLMANSGVMYFKLSIYAGNTVPHLLSGKAVSCALRGHQLVDLVFNTILLYYWM